MNVSVIDLDKVKHLDKKTFEGFFYISVSYISVFKNILNNSSKTIMVNIFFSFYKPKLILHIYIITIIFDKKK